MNKPNICASRITGMAHAEYCRYFTDNHARLVPQGDPSEDQSLVRSVRRVSLHKGLPGPMGMPCTMACARRGFLSAEESPALRSYSREIEACLQDSIELAKFRCPGGSRAGARHDLVASAWNVGHRPVSTTSNSRCHKP